MCEEKRYQQIFNFKMSYSNLNLPQLNAFGVILNLYINTNMPRNRRLNARLKRKVCQPSDGIIVFTIILF